MGVWDSGQERYLSIDSGSPMLFLLLLLLLCDLVCIQFVNFVLFAQQLLCVTMIVKGKANEREWIFYSSLACTTPW